jgi:hypothetical protein
LKVRFLPRSPTFQQLGSFGPNLVLAIVSLLDLMAGHCGNLIDVLVLEVSEFVGQGEAF